MSNAIKIIVGLVLASLLWLGTTAYISSNTKSYLTSYILKSNNLYQAKGMQMAVEDFEKGFFSSTAKIKIDFTEPKLRELLFETIKLPIEVDYKIENGPIFFKEGLGFGSSRISSHVNLSEYFVDKEVFQKIFKEDIQLTSSTSVGFSNNASFVAKTNKIIANIDGDEVYISPLNIEGEMNLKTFQGQMKFLVDSVLTENKKELFHLKNISLEADISKFYDNGFYLGDFVFSLDSIDMKKEHLPFELKGAKVALEINIDENKDETIDMNFKVHANVGDSKLPMEYASLDALEFTYALKGTKLEGILAFQDFTKKIQAKEQKLMARLQSPSTGELDMEVLAELEKLQVKTTEDLMVLLAGLLKKDSSNFDAEIRMIDKKAKSSHLKMNIGYVGDQVLPTEAKALGELFKKELFNLITVNFDVNLEKAYIDNLTPEFQQALAGQLQMGVMFGIVKESNSSFSFDVNYAKDKRLMINGADRSEMLQMLEMSLVN